MWKAIEDPKAKEMVDIVSRYLGGKRPKYSDKLKSGRWYKWVYLQPSDETLTLIMQHLNRCGFYQKYELRRGYSFFGARSHNFSGVGLKVLKESK